MFFLSSLVAFKYCEYASQKEFRSWQRCTISIPGGRLSLSFTVLVATNFERRSPCCGRHTVREKVASVTQKTWKKGLESHGPCRTRGRLCVRVEHRYVASLDSMVINISCVSAWAEGVALWQSRGWQWRCGRRPPGIPKDQGSELRSSILQADHNPKLELEDERLGIKGSKEWYNGPENVEYWH